MTLRTYTCHHCSAVFALKISIQDHIHSQHMEHTKPVIKIPPHFIDNGNFFIRADIDDTKVKYENNAMVNFINKKIEHEEDQNDTNSSFIKRELGYEDNELYPAQGKPIQERKFKCQMCNKSFDHKSNLRRHMASTHDLQKKYKCKFCSRVYRYKWNLKSHLRQHKGPKILTCSHCTKGFALKSKLSKHLKQHLGDVKQCHICFEVFEERELLEEHEKSHQNRKFKCPSCERIFTSETRMRTHIDMKHEGENLFKCKKCLKVFADETRFYLHERSVHHKFFRCSECEKRFANEDIMRQHFRNYHNKEEAYVCIYCYDSFETKSTLIDHFFDHGNPIMCNHCFLMFPDEASLRSHDCDCCFTCPFCSRKYKIEKHLEKHIESCIQLTTSTTQLKTLQKCRYCQRMFRNEDKLTAHELNHTMEKTLYKCLYCHKVFKKLTSYEKHMENHSRHTLYKCHLCTKAYPTEKNLERHLLSHNVRTSFRCKSCGKRFESEELLVEHQIIHERKIHVCPQCNEAFKNKKNLKQHLLAHEKVKVYHCPKCPKLFRHESHLQNHIIVHDESEVHKCLYCFKIFVHKAHLDKHLILHETNEMHNCEFCPMTFPNEGDLLRHIRSHEEYHHSRNRCDMCGEKFATDLKLKAHYNHVHAMFTCMHCGETCSSVKDYNSHLLNIHNIESAQQVEKNFSNMYKCDNCMKIFSTEIHLRNHKKYIHDKLHLVKAHSCHYCSKAFAFHSLLTTHIEYHHGQNNMESESNQSSFMYNDETSNYSNMKQEEDSSDTYMDDMNEMSHVYVKQGACEEKENMPASEPMDEDMNTSSDIYDEKVKDEPVSTSNSIVPINYIKEEEDLSEDAVSTSNTMIPICYIKPGIISDEMEFSHQHNGDYYSEETTEPYLDDDEELQEEDITNHLHEIQNEDTQNHLIEIKQYHLQVDNNEMLVNTFENSIKKDVDIEDNVFNKSEVPQENQENILNHVESESHSCSQCNTSYLKMKDLLAHVDKAHNNQMIELSNPVET